jgi:hypothetical protein
MYTLQEKPDQHATHITRSVRIWSKTICISCGQRMSTFRVVPTRSKQAPTPRRNLGDQKQTRPAVILGHLRPSAQPWSRGERFWPSGYTTTLSYWAHIPARDTCSRGQPIGP